MRIVLFVDECLLMIPCWVSLCDGSGLFHVGLLSSREQAGRFGDLLLQIQLGEVGIVHSVLRAPLYKCALDPFRRREGHARKPVSPGQGCLSKLALRA